MTAGYSGTPLGKKLGIRAGHRVVALNAPADFAALLAPVPEGVDYDSRLDSRPADVVIYFTKERAALVQGFRELADAVFPDGGVWIAWPKKASKVATDLDGNKVRKIILASGLVDTKVCAIDAVWSGLRAVYRQADRPKPSRSR